MDPIGKNNLPLHSLEIIKLIYCKLTITGFQFSAKREGVYNLRQLDHIINLDNYDEDLLDSLSSGEENVLQALPTNVSSQGPLLNVTLYEKAGVEIPTTWDELM